MPQFPPYLLMLPKYSFETAPLERQVSLNQHVLASEEPATFHHPLLTNRGRRAIHTSATNLSPLLAPHMQKGKDSVPQLPASCNQRMGRRQPESTWWTAAVGIWVSHRTSCAGKELHCSQVIPDAIPSLQGLQAAHNLG